MDYLLAAHINVTGGAEAAAQFANMSVQINNFAASAQKANAGNLGAGIKQATDEAGKFSQALSTVGFALTRMLTYQGIHVIQQGIGEAIDSVLDFNHAMTESLAIQSGVSSEMRGNMESMAKSLAVDFGTAPDEVAKGFYYMASAGLEAEEQIAALPTVMEFARAGSMNLAKATEQLFDSLTAIGQRSDDPRVMAMNLGNLSDTLTQAAIKSQASIGEMGYALTTKAGASIKAFNLDLNESVGVLEVFANQGIKGRTAGERFSMLIRDMALKSQKFGDDWERMGIQVFDSEGHFNSLVTIFEQLDAALLPLSEQERIQALSDMGFTLRDMNTIMSVLGQSGNLKEFTADLENAGGMAHQVAENQMESLRNKMAQLGASFRVGAIEGFDKLVEFGGWLSNTFAPAIEKVSPALGALGRGIGPVFAGLGTAIGGVSAGALTGLAEAIERIGSFASEHQGAVTAFGLALGGLAAAKAVEGFAALAAHLGGPLVGAVGNVVAGFQRIGAEMIAVRAAGGSMGEALTTGIGGLVRMLNPLTLGLAAIGVTMGLAWMNMKREAEDARQTIEAMNNEIGGKMGTSADQATQGWVRLREEMNNGRQTMSSLGEATRDAMLHQTNLKLTSKDLTEVYSDLGISGDHVVAALSGGTDVFDMWAEHARDSNMTIGKMRESLAGLPPEVQHLGEALLSAAESGQLGTDEFYKIVDTFDDMADAADDGTEAWMANARAMLMSAQSTGEINSDWLKARGIWDLATASATDLERAINDLNAAQSNPAAHNRMGESAREGLKAMEEVATAARDAAEAIEEFQAALDTLSLPATAMEATAKAAQGMNDLWELSHKYVTESGPLETAFTNHTKEANDMQIAYSGLTLEAFKWAGHLADQGKLVEAKQHMVGFREGIVGMMRGFEISEPAIQAVIASLGLTDQALTGLDGKEAEVKVTAPTAPTVAAEVKAAAPETMNTTVWMEADAAALGTTKTQLDEAAARRESEAHQFPTGQDFATAEFLASTVYRQSEANQFPTGFPFVNSEFENSTQFRSSQANQYGTGHPTVASQFDGSTGKRSSVAEQLGYGWQTVNSNFDYAARNRTAYVDIQTTYTSINVPGPGGAASIATAAEGGIIHAYAPGGFENHRAQIARRGGPMRLWAEPETGGEAYIPLSLSKRDRSLKIWEETGRLLGAGSMRNGMSVSAPVSVTINGATDPHATGQMVAEKVEAGITTAMRKLLVELRSV